MPAQIPGFYADCNWLPVWPESSKHQMFDLEHLEGRQSNDLRNRKWILGHGVYNPVGELASTLATGKIKSGAAKGSASTSFPCAGTRNESYSTEAAVIKPCVKE